MMGGLLLASMYAFPVLVEVYLYMHTDHKTEHASHLECGLDHIWFVNMVMTLHSKIIVYQLGAYC